MSNKPGQYWDEPLNMARHIKCNCEVPNCWAKAMIKQYGWKLGWFPEQADKVSTTGKAKVYATQWLGDIAFLSELEIVTIFHVIHHNNNLRARLDKEPHKYLILTKYPQLFHNKFCNGHGEHAIPILALQSRNIYIGISASDQRTFDKRIEWLLKFDGFKKWVSLEPLYGGIDLRLHNVLNVPWAGGEKMGGRDYTPISSFIDQVIVGGQTGGKYKANLDHFRSIRDQCYEEVRFFLKHIDKEHGCKLDGVEHNQLIWRPSCGAKSEEE